MAKKRKQVEEEDLANKDWGFEHLYNRFLGWVDTLSDSKVRTYSAVGALVAVILVVVAALLPLPSFVEAAIAFPAALIFFGMGSALMHIKHRKDESETLKERYSFAARTRLTAYIGVAVLILIFVAGSYIPYTVGGTLLLTAVLLLYNFLRRTPVEIEIAQAGLLDPRDVAVLDEDEEELEEELTEEFFDDNFFEGEGETR